MNTSLNVALLPLEIEWGDKGKNISAVTAAMKHLHPRTDLVILPETFSTGFPAGMDKEAVRELAERNTGKTIDTLKAIVSEYSVAMAGSFVADSGGSLYNRAFLIEPQGDEVFADKRHLFTMAGENRIFSAGFNRLQVRYRGWNISMVVCYDIRFPVWCRNVLNSYDLLIAVANWPSVRVDAWNQLLKARAIENEAYVAGVNCKGTDPGGFGYDGASAVYDFKGKNITVHSDDTPFLYARLEAEKLARFREKFPAWHDADTFELKS